MRGLLVACAAAVIQLVQVAAFGVVGLLETQGVTVEGVEEVMDAGLHVEAGAGGRGCDGGRGGSRGRGSVALLLQQPGDALLEGLQALA